MEIRKHGVLNNIWFIYKPAFKSSPTYIIAFIIEALLYVALPLWGITSKCICNRNACLSDKNLDNTAGGAFSIFCVWYFQCFI